jgi:hypothetical protein
MARQWAKLLLGGTRNCFRPFLDRDPALPLHALLLQPQPLDAARDPQSLQLSGQCASGDSVSPQIVEVLELQVPASSFAAPAARCDTPSNPLILTPLPLQAFAGGSSPLPLSKRLWRLVTQPGRFLSPPLSIRLSRSTLIKRHPYQPPRTAHQGASCTRRTAYIVVNCRK